MNVFFLQKIMQEKTFIMIAKPFNVSQRNVGSSSTKNMPRPAVSIEVSKPDSRSRFRFKIQDSDQDHLQIQDQSLDTYKIKLPNTNNVREILCNFAVFRKTYCRI